MESEEYGDDSNTERSSEAILSVRIALLETLQTTGFDETSENRVLAYQSLVCGSDVFNCVPTDAHSRNEALCYVSCTRVND